LLYCQDQAQDFKGLAQAPKEILNYKNEWTMSNFFEKPYDCWHEQESLYNHAQESTYKAEKATYDAFCAEHPPDPIYISSSIECHGCP
jgi:hypothetical protein